MKKVLLVVALLLLATPVFAADVTITMTKSGPLVGNVQKVDVGYTGAASADAIRAFALSLTVDMTSDANIQNIRDFNRGESNKPGGGYGIFPAKFRQYITPLNGNTVYTGDGGWYDPNYTPLAEWGDPNAGWGNQTKWIVVELGTLYTDANTPGTSGTLFAIDVCTPAECNLCIALDQIRGGVVKKDANAATVTLPPGGSGAPAGCIRVGPPSCTTVPDITGMTSANGCNALTAVGLVCGSVSAKYSDTVAAGLIISQTPIGGSCVTPGSSVDYVVSLGRMPTPAQIIYPRWDPDSNVPVYWSQVAGATSYELDRSSNSGGAWANVYTGTATFKSERLETTGAGYRWRVRALNADSTSLYNTSTVDCNAYRSTCYRNGVTSDPNWATWLSAGRPDCWCKATAAQEPNGSGYQCDGDADGATSGAPFNYRVYLNDMSAVTNNYKKTAAQLTTDPNVVLSGKRKIVSAPCADVDHKSSGAPFNYRVYLGDLNIVIANYKKLDSSTVTATNRLPGTCPR